MKPNHTPKKTRPLAALFSLLALSLNAQTTNPASTPAPAPAPATAPATPAQEETIQLEVFTVNANDDTGYVTEKGLSGGRLVTDLNDIAAPIAVLTKEFMDDIGGIDLASITDYAVNTQLELSDGNNADIFTASTEGLGRDNTNVRIRGLGGSRTLDFLDYDWNIDNYNTSRTDFSLGPNAILFGNGGPGGNINFTRDRANLTKNFRRVTLQTDSEGSFRSTFDVNLVLARRKAALRLEGMHTERNTWRTHDFNDRQGLYANLNLQPTPDTNINIALEQGENRAQADRIIGPGDNISAWLAGGALTGPTGTIATTATLPAGLTIAPNRTNNGLAETNNFVVGGPYTVPTERTNTRLNNTYTGPVLYRTGNSPGLPIPYHPAGAGFGSGGTFGTPDLFLQRDGVVDFIGTAMAGPDSYRSQEFDDVRISVEQKLAQDLFLNAFFGSNSTDRFAQTLNRTPAAFSLNGEPNSQFPDQVGQMFIEGRWQRDFEYNKRTAYGATLAWNFNVRGTEHRFSGFIQKDEHNRFFRGGVPLRLAAIRRDPVTGAISNQPIFTRSYFDLGDQTAHARLIEPTGPFIDANGVSWEAAWVPDNIAELDESNAPYISETNTRSYYTLYGQSYFFQRRLVASYGYRQDRTQTVRDLYAMDTATLDAATTPSARVVNDVLTPDSKSAGLVYHFPHRLSLSAGISQNVGTAQETYVLPDASQPPPVKSSAKDIGLRWSLPSEKLNFRISYFETERTGGYQVANDAFWDDITGDGNSGLQRLATPLVANVSGVLDEEYEIARPMAPIITSLESAGLIDAVRATTLRQALVAPVPSSGNVDRIQSTVNANLAPDGSKGYEFRAAGELGNLNIILNYSYTKRQKQGHADDGLALFEDLIGLVRQLPAGTVLPPGTPYSNVVALSSNDTPLPAGTTPSVPKMYEQALLAAHTQLSSLAEQRETAFGNRPHFVNLVTRYNFKEGALKGLALRARANWRSETYAQNIRTPNTAGTAITQEAVYGPALYDGGVGLTYKRKLRHRWFDSYTVDLDIDNIFFSKVKVVPIKYLRANDTIPGVGEYEVLARDPDGNPIGNAFVYQAPRLYRLRVGFEF